MSDKKRYMNDLRVIDLRVELEQRKLDKTGVRAVLLKRLAQFLKDEGHDPDTYQFDPLGVDAKGSPPKRLSQAENSADIAEDADEGMVDVRVEDMIVQEEVGDEDEDEPENAVPEVTAHVKQELTIKSEPMETETKTPVTEPHKRKRESKEESEVVEAKKPKAQKVEEAKVSEDVKAELNNTDAEDSINLDIGEDELLNDDGESAAKTQKGRSTGRKSDRPLTSVTAVEEGGDASKKAAKAVTAATGAPAGAPADKQDDPQVKPDDNTTSESTDDKKEKEDKDAKGDSETCGKKEDGKDSAASAARNLWVSGLSGDTRAKDLKQLCSKHGKVIGAKVVTNARTPGSRCYGYVTMASAQDAENCIKNLHRTELHGRLISVEKAKSEASGGPASTRRKETSKDENAETKKEENGEAKEGEGEKRTDESRSRSRDTRPGGLGDKTRRRSRDRKRSPKDALSFNKIWRERDAQRTRERSRLARDEERRRRQAEEELRERERQQRIENRRIALERQKLRQERERIEREKKELLRLERERHKLEREKLELERLELKRAQQRLEEERRKRAYEPPPTYRKPASPPPPPYERDARHKRAPPPLVRAAAAPAKYNVTGRSGFEAPPPPRFEISASYDRAADKRPERADYKRDYNPRHVSSSSAKYPSNGTSTDDTRQPLPVASRPKEPASRATYEVRERGTGYRSPPAGKPEPRAWATSRYPDAAPTAKADYVERSGTGGWSSSGATAKSYPSSRHVTAPASSQSWSKPSGGGSGSSEPWQSASSGGDSRYGYEPRSYPAAYQPPPPGSGPYVDRYAQPASRDYRPKY